MEVGSKGYALARGAITCGDRTWTASPGFVRLPSPRYPHTFKASDAGPLKMLQLTLPAEFERFSADVAAQARTKNLPEPTEPDVPNLLAAAAKYGHRDPALATLIARFKLLALTDIINVT